MFDQIIGFTTLGGFALVLLLFLSRMFFVSPYSSAYRPVIWTFFWVFALTILLGDLSLALQIFPLMHMWATVLKCVVGTIASVVVLGFEAVIFLVLCLGMNFMGQ